MQGKRFAFVDPASTSGHLYPKTLLLSKGFEPKIFFGKSVFAGSHNAVFLYIYKGAVDGGAAYDGSRAAVAKSYPDVFEKIKSLPIPRKYPTTRYLSAKKIPEDLKAKVIDGLKKISKSPKGSKVLKRLYGISGLVDLDGLFDPVREAERLLNLDLSKALRDVSLSIEAGGFVVVLGESGSGKSTLLRWINRLVEQTSSRVFLKN